MMESGKYASVTDLAVAEKINDSYVCRTLRLTLLTPDIVETALDGRLNPAVELAELRSLPAEWSLQRTKLAVTVEYLATRSQPRCRSNERCPRYSGARCLGTL